MRTSMRISGGVLAGLVTIAIGVPAQAGDTKNWSTVDSGVTNTARPGLLRVGDTLDVVWTKSTGSSGMYRRNYSATGVGSPVATVLSGWSALAADPVPQGPGIAVSGLRGTPGGSDYWNGKGFLTDSAGSIAGTLSSGLYAYLGEHDLDVVAGQPMYVYSRTDSGKLLLHSGLGPAGSGTTGTPGPGSDHEVAVGGCCMYYPSYRWSWWIADAGTGANADSSGWLAWYSNSSTAQESGWLVRSVEDLPGPPTLGPVMQAPLTLTGGGSVSATQRAALTRTPQNGVWFAYPVGYPTPKSIRVWKLGTDTAITYAPGHSVAHVALSAAPDGRLWLAYYSPDTDKVYTLRSDPAATRFGQAAALSSPSPDYLYSTAIEATSAWADLVVNDGTTLHHRQSLPALSASAKAIAVPKKKMVLKVTVTDAGQPVSGAKVKALGKSKVTNGSGKVTFKKKVKGSPPKKVTGKAGKTGYYPRNFSAKVKKG